MAHFVPLSAQDVADSLFGSGDIPLATGPAYDVPLEQENVSSAVENMADLFVDHTSFTSLKNTRPSSAQ
jgi:hypothetical protein